LRQEAAATASLNHIKLKTREHYSRAVHDIMSAFQRSGGFLPELVGKTYPQPTLRLEAGKILAKLYSIKKAVFRGILLDGGGKLDGV